MSNLNRIRELAGVEPSTPTEKAILKEDTDGFSAIKHGGSHKFYLVQGASSGSELNKVVTEVDIAALGNIMRGADKKLIHKEKWELFPHTMRTEALALAQKRINAAKSGSAEEEEESAKPTKKALKALEHIVNYLHGEVGKHHKSRDPDLVSAYSKVYSAYHGVLNSVKQGNLTAARETYNAMEIGDKEHLSDEKLIPSLVTRKELRSLLVAKPVHEQEEEEEMTMTVVAGSVCPHCGQMMPPDQDQAEQPPMDGVPGQEEKPGTAPVSSFIPPEAHGAAPVSMGGEAVETKEEPIVEIEKSTVDTSVHFNDGKPKDNWESKDKITDKAKADTKEKEIKKDATTSFPALKHEDEPGKDTKVAVPSSVKTSLNDAIKEAKQRVERAKTQEDQESLGFYEEFVNVLEVLKKHMEHGTVEHLKFAQVDLTKLMSPMLHMVPNDVVEFLAKDDNKQSLSLKDLFADLKRKKAAEESPEYSVTKAHAEAEKVKKQSNKE